VTAERLHTELLCFEEIKQIFYYPCLGCKQNIKV